MKTGQQQGLWVHLLWGQAGPPLLQLSAGWDPTGFRNFSLTLDSSTLPPAASYTSTCKERAEESDEPFFLSTLPTKQCLKEAARGSERWLRALAVQSPLLEPRSQHPQNKPGPASTCNPSSNKGRARRLSRTCWIPAYPKNCQSWVQGEPLPQKDGWRIMGRAVTASSDLHEGTQACAPMHICTYSPRHIHI